MNDRQNRTIICSVLFLDIADYSRKPVAEQIRLRECLNALLSEALLCVAPKDRVILDTGDGAAISFLGDPEDALFVALTLRDALAAGPSAADPLLAMRFGINVGPVKLIKDLNGQPNIIGDGINVAQRIMSFSEPGQVLVARSYYEMVSRLSEEYSRLFRYEGSRTDKHVREHEVYAVDARSSALKRPSPVRRLLGVRKFASRMQVARRLAETTTTIRNNLRRRPQVVTVVAASAILAAGIVVRGNREAPAQTITEARPAALQLVALTEKKTTAPPAETPRPEDTARAAKVEDIPVAAETERARPKAKKTEIPAHGAVATSRKETSAQTLLVTLAISPWGEIYVDGKKQGVSPPLRNIQVTPGKHKIEVKNTDFPSRVEMIEAKPGSQISIKHKFQSGGA